MILRYNDKEPHLPMQIIIGYAIKFFTNITRGIGNQNGVT